MAQMNPTVAAYLETYMNTKSAAIQGQSLDRLESTVQCQIIPRIGERIKVRDFRCADYQNRILAPQIAEELSYSTVAKTYDALHAMLRMAVLERIIPINPLDMIGKPKKAVIETRLIQPDDDSDNANTAVALSLPECRTLMRTARMLTASGHLKWRHGEAIILDMATGLRESELYALRWCNVDFARSEILVSEKLTRVKDRNPNSDTFNKTVFQVQYGTKNGETRRVNLCQDAQDALRALKKAQEEAGISSQYVVCDSKGNIIKPKDVNKQLKSICKHAKIVLPKGHSMHVLRHTFASVLFAQGVPVQVVSKLLGHKSVNVTQNIYIHLIANQAADAVASVKFS